MNCKIYTMITILVLIVVATISSSAMAVDSDGQIVIFRRGEYPPTKGSEKQYTGSVLSYQPFKTELPATLTGEQIAFAPGARSAWHTNPKGETLIVSSGKCLVQEEGGPIETALAGDVVSFPPNIKHWYGAAPDCDTSVLAISEATDSKTTDWLEKVTDAQYEAKTGNGSKHITIALAGSKPSGKADPKHFTGIPRLDSLFSSNGGTQAYGAIVTFEPCSRTDWHSHPMGQTFIVTSGRGYVQRPDGPRFEIRQGDIAWTPADVLHWHGAAPDTHMAHLALSEHAEGKNVTWGAKVTDEEYGAVNTKEMPEKLKKIALISAFTASGDMNMLKKVMVEGLEAGLTVNQIKEILIHDSAYAGFPRALNAINTFISVMDEREKQGIKDEYGPEATPVDWQGKDKYKYGHQTLADLRKVPVGTGSKPRYELFTPTIEVFLKEHLFADIFARDTLKYLEREIATVGALSNLPGANAQFRAHTGLAMTQGVTEEQMKDLFTCMGNYFGREREDNAKTVLEEAVKVKK